MGLRMWTSCLIGSKSSTSVGDIRICSADRPWSFGPCTSKSQNPNIDPKCQTLYDYRCSAEKGEVDIVDMVDMSCTPLEM